MADKVGGSDRDLGMGCPIQRRDFLNGVLVGAGALAVGSGLAGCSGTEGEPGAYYPPLRTGMRGSHPGSFEAAHALRDGSAFPPPKDTHESYDLVVVGGGISGLATAAFYLDAKPNARILILENHDDFGGHAKRNEFRDGRRVRIMNGGTADIDSPRPYSAIADGLIRRIGIDPVGMKSIEQDDFYKSRGMSDGLFFDKDTFGADALAVGVGRKPWPDLLATARISPKVRDEIIRIEARPADFLPGLTSPEKKEKLSRISYLAYLRDIAKVDAAALPFYQTVSHGWWSIGIDAISALDAWGMGFSGFAGLNLAPGGIERMGYTPQGYADTGGSYTLHFPDGNATIARLLVRHLIPEALPGTTATDAISATADYAALDRPGQAVRIRLNSMVLKATHVGDPSTAREVQITFVEHGAIKTVRAAHCVLASYNMMIPYIVPELPDVQKTALHSLVKSPLVYASVALRNWQAFDRLKLRGVRAPGCMFTSFNLAPSIDVGDFHTTRDPSEPALVHMEYTPCQPGFSEDEQNRAGRAILLETTMETFERNIRDQLGRTLSGGGFDPAKDITAITVNRWPHGYAPEFNPLWDELRPPDKRKNVIARARFGRMAIANSDAGAAAYTDSAIDQAHRAVGELLG